MKITFRASYPLSIKTQRLSAKKFSKLSKKNQSLQQLHLVFAQKHAMVQARAHFILEGKLRIAEVEDKTIGASLDHLEKKVESQIERAKIKHAPQLGRHEKAYGRWVRHEGFQNL